MKEMIAASISKEKTGPKTVFVVFCAWAIVLLSRPQDFVPWLAAVRPALVLGALVLILYVVNHDRYRLKFMSNPQCRLLGFLVIMVLLSVPFAVYRRAALEAFFAWFAQGILFIYVLYKIVDNTEDLKTLLWLLCLGAGAYSLVALYRGEVGEMRRLAFGGFFDPNDLAFFLVSFLPLNLLFLPKDNPSWKRLACLINVSAGILLILMTGSRGGFVALALIVLMLLFTRTLIIKRTYKVMIVVIVFTIVIFGSSLINFARLGTIMHLEEDYNAFDETGRLVVWKKGFELMLSRPLTGVGVGCFNEAIGQDRRSRGLQEIWQAPHNSLVQIGTETGIVGLILFVIISYNAFRIFGKAKSMTISDELAKIGEMARIGFVGHFAASMFLSQAYSVYWLFYIVVSAVIARYESETMSSNTT